ncbi:hypothetical protein [Teredinibacter sp. KSP-S5-2]|uniref:LpxL/LpxP family acyltransferase n=1 Tax=Teredinibacter sp. KSP-S5-2 TaxID=3034506 RepID=UPI002934A262|nr:hypothetical protein [Teredinibacter sp. KSP-S5-2]WNO09245.1 hypothetical protein P5V12_20080 [Teredinibacter sp. KSP-S5-2]
MADSRWTEVKERGNYWGMKALMVLYAWGGKWLMYPVLLVVVFYFFISNRETRRCSLAYLQRVNREKGGNWAQPNLWLSWRHYMAFADALFQRASAWLGHIKLKDITFEEKEEILSLTRQRKGVIILGSHAGNLEMSRAVIGEEDVVMNVVVNSRHTEQFNRLLRSLSSSVDVNLIAMDELTPATAISIREKLDRGECLVLLADRIAQGSENRKIAARFLGDDVFLPEGAFRLAVALGAPVVFMSCVKAANGYEVVYDNIGEKVKQRAASAKRGDRVQALAAVYLDALSDLCKAHPLQWFNFYDYWGDFTPQTQKELNQQSLTEEATRSIGKND